MPAATGELFGPPSLRARKDCVWPNWQIKNLFFWPQATQPRPLNWNARLSLLLPRGYLDWPNVGAGGTPKAKPRPRKPVCSWPGWRGRLCWPVEYSGQFEPPRVGPNEKTTAPSIAAKPAISVACPGLREPPRGHCPTGGHYPMCRCGARRSGPLSSSRSTGPWHGKVGQKADFLAAPDTESYITLLTARGMARGR